MVDSRVNFGFAFNDPYFSDRVLHIEITLDSLASESVSDKKHATESSETYQENESSTVVEVKTFHISSPILAGNSPFFYKLLKNGMRESLQRDDVTLRINKSEETALTELLNFMYSNTLSATTTDELLGLLIIADKFEVTSCMRYCCELLLKMPMSLESALLYLKLPSSVLVFDAFKPLIVEVQKWLAEHYRDVNKYLEEVMALPLSAIEIVLDSQTLQVNLSDDVFEFILEWARTHYPKLEERREILSKRLRHVIRFRYMSCSKLKEVLVCPDFDHEEVSNSMLEALFFKIEGPYGQHIHDSNNDNKFEVIKVEQFPHLRSFVYFEIKTEECEKLLRLGKIYSPLFYLDGRQFKLLVQRSGEEHPDSLGLFVYMTKESESFTLEYDFAGMKKSSKEFQTITAGKISDQASLMLGWGTRDLLEIPWKDLMDNDNEYFIDGILHLRADLTIINDNIA